MIHGKFAELYAIESGEQFAMEIEFKITSDNILAIKQARLWVFPNPPAAGLPIISGIVQVGNELTAGTSAIDDTDGIANAQFTYQWLADEDEMEGATNSAYILAPADAGKTIKVRVTFTDDAGKSESLTSVATAVVAATNPEAPLHVRVSAHDSDSLDVSWEAPVSNGGSPVTPGYKVRWKQVSDSWDAAGDVSDETVTGTTHTIDRLTEGVEYTVRVNAVNAVGDGPSSVEATGTPMETTPPQLGTALVDGDTLTLTYGEALEENSTPATTTFEVTVGGEGARG